MQMQGKAVGAKGRAGPDGYSGPPMQYPGCGSGNYGSGGPGSYHHTGPHGQGRIYGPPGGEGGGSAGSSKGYSYGHGGPAVGAQGGFGGLSGSSGLRQRGISIGGSEPSGKGSFRPQGPQGPSGLQGPQGPRGEGACGGPAGRGSCGPIGGCPNSLVPQGPVPQGPRNPGLQEA